MTGDSYERQCWKRFLVRAEQLGVPVDPSWRKFQNFLKDLGPRPKGYYLHRDWRGPFKKGYCRWTKGSALQKGTGPFRVVTYGFESKTVEEWSELTGISVAHISQRLYRRWPIASVLGFAPPPTAHDATYVMWRRLNSQKTSSVAPRWRGEQGFQNFLQDMGERPKGRVLTRQDLSKGFSPQNCIYVTRGQMRSLHAKKYRALGKSLTIREWARETGIPIHILKTRIEMRGLSMGEAIKKGPAKSLGKQALSAEEQSKVLWYNLRARLNNPGCPSYKHWGARGFKLCKRWHSFELFLQDMGPRPERASICINPGCKVFSKKNCYYGTHAEVLRVSNYRDNKITYNGKTMSVTEWAKERGLPFSTLYQRIMILGWSKSEALGFKQKRERRVKAVVTRGWGGLKIA